MTESEIKTNKGRRARVLMEIAMNRRLSREEAYKAISWIQENRDNK